MGGTVARLAAEGHRVLLLDITNGEPTPLGDPETRAIEAANAAKILSAPGNPVTRRLLGLPNRYVVHSIENRHAVAGVIREWQADVIFTPFFEDAHPDHLAVTRIVEDARFDAKLRKIDLPGEPIYPKWLFYYYATHLRWVANPNFLIDVTGFLDQKLAAIRAYQTQFVRANAHVVEWIEAGTRYMGSRLGVPAAEAFYTKEPIGLAGLSGLVM